MESTALSVCIMEAPENIPTVFEDVFVALPTVSGQVVYDAIVNHLKLVEKRYDMNRVHIYFIPPDTSRLLWIKPVVSKEKLDSYVEIDKDTNFENFLELPVIKNSPKLRTEYQEGLPSGARFVAVLPQVAIGGGSEVSTGDDLIVLRNELEKMKLRMEIEALQSKYQQFVPQPIPIPGSAKLSASAASSTSHASRIELKRKVIEDYGLFVEKDKSKRGSDPMVTSMIGGNLTFKKATLAHIWAQRYIANEPMTEGLRKLLDLPDGFEKDSRNFLILPKKMEVSFDCGLLFLFPKKPTGPTDSPSVVCKVIDPAYKKRYKNWDGKLLQFKKQLPFLRLLGWVAFAHMKERNSDIDTVNMLEVDASIIDVEKAAAIRRVVGITFGSDAERQDILRLQKLLGKK